MTTLQDLQPTFRAFQPAVAKDFHDFVGGHMRRLLDTYGKDGTHRLSASWHHDGQLFRAFGYKVFDFNPKGRDILGINEERLENMSQQYAKDQIDRFILKLLRKLGNLREVSIYDIDFGGFRFSLRGLGPNGEVISVIQTRIVNCSSKGKVFHQWPASICLDSKKISEAKLKEIIGGTP